MAGITAGGGPRPGPWAKNQGQRRAAGIYGAIITAAIFDTAGSHLPTGALVITVVVTLLVYWLAEEYAELLGEQAEGGHLPSRASIRRALAATWPMVSASFAPLLALLLARLAGASALTAANAQIAISPDNSGFYDLLGSILLQKKDYSAAEAALKKAVGLNKNNTDAFIKLGQAQAGRGAVDEAIATYQNGSSANPKEAGFYVVSGELYETKHDLEKAKSAYQTALQLKPEDAVASNNLAYVLLETGANPDLALQLAHEEPGPPADVQHDTAVIETVAAVIAERAAGIPLVLDPVMVAKGGAPLIEEGAIGALKRLLVPHAAVLTPNLPEAEILAGHAIIDVVAMREAADELRGLGCHAVLLKGGHLPGDTVYDVLATADGQRVWDSPRIDSRHTHGTGCTLASAIATGLAQGQTIEAAVERARTYVQRAIASAPGLGHGHGPLDHAHPLRTH